MPATFANKPTLVEPAQADLIISLHSKNFRLSAANRSWQQQHDDQQQTKFVILPKFEPEFITATLCSYTARLRGHLRFSVALMSQTRLITWFSSWGWPVVCECACVSVTEYSTVRNYIMAYILGIPRSLTNPTTTKECLLLAAPWACALGAHSFLFRDLKRYWGSSKGC